MFSLLVLIDLNKTEEGKRRSNQADVLYMRVWLAGRGAAGKKSTDVVALRRHGGTGLHSASPQPHASTVARHPRPRLHPPGACPCSSAAAVPASPGHPAARTRLVTSPRFWPEESCGTFVKEEEIKNNMWVPLSVRVVHNPDPHSCIPGVANTSKV
jgi:hypothetical protein